MSMLRSFTKYLIRELTRQVQELSWRLKVFRVLTLSDWCRQAWFSNYLIVDQWQQGTITLSPWWRKLELHTVLGAKSRSAHSHVRWSWTLPLCAVHIWQVVLNFVEWFRFAIRPARGLPAAARQRGRRRGRRIHQGRRAEQLASKNNCKYLARHTSRNKWRARTRPPTSSSKNERRSAERNPLFGKTAVIAHRGQGTAPRSHGRRRGRKSFELRPCNHHFEVVWICGTVVMRCATN